MKHLKIFAILLLLAIACTKEEEPYLNFGEGQNSAIKFPAKESSETISFTANNSWTATSSADWLTINPASGEAGAQNIKITASANADYDTRTATVTIKSQGLSQTIDVTQLENSGFVLSTTNFEIGSDGGTISVPVSANVKFSVSVAKDSESWLSVTQTKGLNNYTIELTAAKNDTYDERVGTVEVSADGETSTVTITQSQLEEMIVGTTEFEIGVDGGMIKVPVSSNIEYSAEVISGAEWLEIATLQTKGIEDYFMSVSVKANTEYDNRIGQVKVSGAGKESVVTITQSKLEGFVLEKTEYEISNVGGEIIIPVKSNVEYTIEVINGASEWITISSEQTKSLEESSIRLVVAENKDYDGRTGQIKISGKDKESIVSIIQSQVDALLVTENEITKSSEAGTAELKLQTNIAYKVEIPTDAQSWLSVVESKAMQDGMVTFSFTLNEGAQRKAEVSIKNEQGAVMQSINVVQLGNGEVIVDVTNGLKNALSGYDLTKISYLKITGILNNDDFTLIKEMKSLKTLDISEVNISEIPDGAFSRSKITSIFLPKTLTVIGKESFRWSRLQKVTIPSSVETIEEKAFGECEYLWSVDYEQPSKLKSIGLGAFYGCKLVELEIPASVETLEEMAFLDCESLETVTFEENSIIRKMGHGVFRYCTSLKSIEIPASVETMGSSAFENCSSLKSIEIPANVEKIDSCAFKGCTLLESVTFEANSTLKSIAGGYEVNVYDGSSNGAFENCTSLKSIEIPASVETIGDGTFRDCTSLETVTFEAGSKLKTFEGNTFSGYTSLKTVGIPASIETLVIGTFEGCTSLETVTFEAGSKLKTIEGNTFSKCSSLKSIEIPASVETIGDGTFRDCTSLETVTFEAGSKLKTIEGNTFSSCSSLKSIEIPASVETIGDETFRSCTSLESIEIPASVETIGTYAFYYCKSLESVTFEAGSKLKAIADDTFKDCKSLKTIVLPASIKTVGHRSFEGCESLKSIKLPANIKSIESSAFTCCTSLEKADMAECKMISFIGNLAFYGCQNLSLVKIGTATPPTCPIEFGSDTYVFDGISSDAELKVPYGSVEAYKTAIGWRTFSNISALDE